MTTAFLSLHCVTVDIQWAKLVFSDTHRSSPVFALKPLNQIFAKLKG